MKANKLIPLLRRGDGSTLSLDFTTMGSLDSRFTFTRASTGTYINSAGLVTTMAAASTNDPTKARFDYDPTTLAPRGLLIEGSATNLLIYTQRINVGSGAWFFGGSGTRSTTPDYTTGPDGVALSATRLQLAINAGLKQLGGTVNTNITVSVWAKSNTGSNQNMAFWTGTAADIKVVTPQWQRFQSVVNFSSSPAFDFYKYDSGDCDISVWGAQLEAGSGASSYIPTGASTEQRAADVCTMSGTNFSSWFNSTEGTFLATGERAITSTFGRLLSANANNTTSAFDLGASTNGRWLITNTTSQADITAGTVTANTAFKVAGAFANNDAQMAFNGTLGTADTSVSLPTVSQLDIGADRTAVYLNGRIRSIKFWPTRLPNATLQSLTQ